MQLAKTDIFFGENIFYGYVIMQQLEKYKYESIIPMIFCRYQEFLGYHISIVNQSKKLIRAVDDLMRIFRKLIS